MKSVDSLLLNLKATLKDVDKFCYKAEKLLKKNNLEEYIFPVQLLLREALVNAVVHGCKKNSNLEIKSYFKITEKEITIEIEDPGDGFDWKAVGSRNYAVSADSGRGLLILDKYASEFVYNKTGNGVLIKKIIVQKEYDHE